MNLTEIFKRYLKPDVIITYQFFPALSNQLRKHGIFYSYTTLERHFRRMRSQGIIQVQKLPRVGKQDRFKIINI